MRNGKVFDLQSNRRSIKLLLYFNGEVHESILRVQGGKDWTIIDLEPAVSTIDSNKECESIWIFI